MKITLIQNLKEMARQGTGSTSTKICRGHTAWIAAETIQRLKRELKKAKMAQKRTRDRRSQIESIENQLFRLGVKNTLE